ncbi:hypothetical protein B0F90DRAFT_1817583 [Multifurca ochricompacta]|uniref:HTH cro/C1-type domain-containing protein n=1 Tax=Multifurca ochricompacta TaxID=376703 RepID=A0AAD4M5N2_9AGAM|nr:hypothetical protein B0F90DRAFT_1817583 [Multifurca ochricompacta]
MASEVQCKALNKAINDNGYSYAQIAAKVGSSEQRVSDICSGRVRPTTQEFNNLATTLRITNPPRDAAHATA